MMMDITTLNTTNENTTAIIESSKLYEEIIQIYTNIGDCYKEMTKFDIALEFYFDSLTIAKHYNNVQFIMLLYECLSKTYLEIGGQSKNAYRYAYQAIPL